MFSLSTAERDHEREITRSRERERERERERDYTFLNIHELPYLERTSGRESLCIIFKEHLCVSLIRCRATVYVYYPEHEFVKIVYAKTTIYNYMDYLERSMTLYMVDIGSVFFLPSGRQRQFSDCIDY